MKRLLLAIALVLVFSLPVIAAPAFNPSNGHYYEKIDDNSVTWTEAKTDAEQMTFMGVSGHLATVTSQNENDWLVSTFALENGDYLLGGYQEEGASELDEGWHWITGEPWGYTNWRSFQCDQYRPGWGWQGPR